jgi:uncharacterized protein YidB (DUF937 family)
MSRGFPSMTALLGLLAVAGYQNRDKLAEMLGGAMQGAPGSAGAGRGSPGAGGAGQGGLGGILGQLGGSLGGAGAGGFLGTGLNELLERFTQNGQGVLDTLSKQTGLSRDELLARLSRELPAAVDKYTPDGRLPPPAAP